MKKSTFMVFAILLALLIFNLPRAQSDPQPTGLPIYYADGTRVANAHVVIGRVTVPGSTATTRADIPVVLKDFAAFTSADSYKCFFTQPAGGSPAVGGMINKRDGSHFDYRVALGYPEWQQDFFCIGN